MFDRRGWTLLVALLPACGGGSHSPASVPIPTAAPTPTPTPIPIYTNSGSGDTVFDMPSRVTRVRIEATYTGFTSNFIVHIAGQHIVNELLGTAWGPTTFSGTYQIGGGGTVEILQSSGVSWVFTEVR